MRQEGEPSVEEILESIKKVMARDKREAALAERRRLETEVVRLREALSSARQAAAAPAAPAVAAAPPPPAKPAATGAPELELEIDVGAAPSPAQAAPAASEVPELDLEIDQSELERPAPPVRARPRAVSELPMIELPDDDSARKKRKLWNAPPPDEDKRRLLTPAQLAEIRKRMAEKMRAAKARAG